MAGKREANRNNLRERLIASASTCIEMRGIHKLNARDVTTQAGCALGSLYTVFKDLDDLVIHVNSRTLRRLGEAIQIASQASREPVDVLKALARGYVAFARANYALWVALFDYATLSGTEIPDWHKEEQSVLIENIFEPLSELSPQMTETQLATRARALFSAVHGIVSNSLADRFIGVSQADLDDELMSFVDQMAAGTGR